MNERKNYQTLGDQEGMVRYLGDIVNRKACPELGATSGDDNSNGSASVDYNILLEYGEFDLQMFLEQNRLPPFLQVEIENFWRDIFQIAEALNRIHNLKIKVDSKSYEVKG
jgi:hypothetical protein